MPRIRTIKPEFPQSESMGRVSREARLCFILLWTLADDSGRLRGNSRMLASLLYPYDEDAKKHIDSWLEELEKEGCVLRYVVDSTSYLQIINWTSHQKIDKPSPSKIPPFDEDSRSLANVRECSSLDQGRDQGEDQGKEGKGEDSAEPQSDSTPSVIEIPLIGKGAFSVTQQQLDEWQATYGAVNVLQQLKEMREWCLANPARKKTRSGVRGFIIRWLGKEQDKDHRRVDGRTEKQKEVERTMDFLLGRTQPTAKPLTHDPDPWDII